ncbi:beta-mannosidase [Microbacterium sp. AG1240]|uniref:glycoside hydrolase family 2 protein n=1 Tax=Microbacterium sp. AG1240 TaxID=2183992 RepID=UPI000F15F5A2|nr:sugar-binding domain-containing protein [Microbacterium sp. AG1240]RKT31637.1 beta-mannosidase [Microbacterium sp. AG1240]
MRTIEFEDLKWRLSAHGELPEGAPSSAGASLPAEVPGAVHDALLHAGIITDPFRGRSEEASAWVADTDWSYETTVELGAPSNGTTWRLEFDGLQTIAEVRVNGETVGRTENMFRRYAFDVTDLLRGGRNTIHVVFRSTVAEMNARAAADGIDYPFDWAHPYNRVRTMASSVGWDWGPTLVSAGLWRTGRLRALTPSAFDVTAVHTRVSDDLRRGTVVIDVAQADAAVTQDVVISMGEHEWVRPITGTHTRIDVHVDDPELWWPRALGAATRHTLTVRSVSDPSAPPTVRKVGFRRVDVDTAADEYGRAFTVRINGRPIFVRGANWIPDDVFAARLTRERYAQRIQQAADANIHLLRVWGGGVYEGDDFYDLCDETGMLVWQDFMFACAAYPETEQLSTEISAEAADVAMRISGHPSVVVWNGSNETELGWHGWGWQERLQGAPWGEDYYRRILPEALHRHDPDAVYIPSSPTSMTPGVAPNVPEEGTAHLWNPWNRLDYAHYRDSVPRFTAEFGWQAPANWSTLADAIGDDEVRADAPALIAHQKQPTGMHNLRERMRMRFPDIERIEQTPHLWHFATQLNQAEAIRTAVEHFRSWWPRAAGSIVWQLNDTWPALSWSVLDYGGGRKLGWFALRRAYADRLVTIQPREAGLSMTVVNDTDEDWTGAALLRRIALAGPVTASGELPFAVAARSVQTLRIPHHLSLPSSERREILVADIEGHTGDTAMRATHTFAMDEFVHLPAPQWSASVTARREDAHHVTTVAVTARTVLTGLSILADKVDRSAVVDSALVTLLPGETHVFSVTSSVPLDPEALTSTPVVMTRNEFHR